MPGARAGRYIMIVVALIVVAGLLAGMMATSGAISPR
jgi:hypothetical protein